MKLSPQSSLLLLSLCALACESTAAEEAKVKQEASHIHPEVPQRLPPEPPADLVRRAELAASASAAPPAKKDWSPRCLASRGCPTKTAAIPSCVPGTKVPGWSETFNDANKLVGKTIEVSGSLGLTGSNPVGKACAPNECCHTLRFGMLLESAPEALLLPGLSCTGDDSELCCSVPAESQKVVARGTLQHATGAGIVKWQLGSASLCTPMSTPQ
jgi:hypothetical protein